MARHKRKQKRQLETRLATVTPIQPKQLPANKGEFVYTQILPHEIVALVPLIHDFYKEINLKPAIENPDPLIAQINREMAINPYSIIYICIDEDLKIHGYMWFRIERNPYGEWFTIIEHDYIISEHRHKLSEARMHDRFISYVLEISERCNCQYVNTVVRTKKLLESRKKLGFEPVEMKMTFNSNGEGVRAFMNRNPRFQRYARYKKEEKKEDKMDNQISVGEV